MAEIDAEIDDLANSVVHEASGQVFPTRIVRWWELLPHQKADLGKWRFDWSKEANQPREDVVGLLVEGLDSLQGLMALESRKGFLFVNLVESASHNVGQNKLFRGVPGNLFAYASALSFALNFDGFLAFDAKSELIDHFTLSLGAKRVGSSNRMIINGVSARRLVEQYRKESDQWPL